MPSYPEQRLRCVIVLVVSTFYLSVSSYFFLDRCVKVLPTIGKSSLGSQFLSN
jgi:hypothetical protein